MQQKLFIAAKQLSPVVLDLEEKMRAAQKASPGAITTTAPGEVLPEAARWAQALELAIHEIHESIPKGATFILVNDDQWGDQTGALKDYRVLPFLERGGNYWGPPTDDENALVELERLRQSGASHVVVAWPSFWWLDHYLRMRQHLRASCTAILENERLKIFRLPS